MRVAAPFVLTAVLALSTSAIAQGPLTSNCTKTKASDPCKIVITMSAGCGSGIKVAPDPIVVPNRTTVFIEWEVQADAWKFEGEGIFIHQNEKVLMKESGGTAKKLKFKNNNPNPATFKYDIILTGPGGTCKLDPTVVNQ